jgi:hypothetical protein
MPTKRAIILRTDGTREELGHKPTLGEAQAIVGGYVEVVKCRDVELGTVVQMLVDEEGHLKRLPVNEEATNHFYGNLIVGDVIVLYGWRFT